MEHFFKPTLGKILYHYTTPEGAKAILQSKALRLSEFSMMNDKSEYTYAKSKFVDAYQNRKVWVEEVPRWMANMKLNTHESATTMMIGCLTEESDDAGLWERYANQGKGCVLGLDAFWLANCSGVAIRKISYDSGYLEDFVNAGLAMLQSHYENNKEDRVELEELASMFVLDLYAFKDPRFKSEREVRISRLTISDKMAEYGLYDIGGHHSDGGDVPALQIYRRQSRYGPTRYLDLPLWDEGQNFAIRSVGFGPNINREEEALVVQAAGSDSQIKFWKSDVPLR